MTLEPTAREWKLIKQCAGKSFATINPHGRLSYEWFLNAAYLALEDAKQSANRDPSDTYLWKCLRDGINKQLNSEFGRRRQRDGSYRELLSFSDLTVDNECTGELEAPVALIERFTAGPSEAALDSGKQELWEWVRANVSGLEYRCIKRWAEGVFGDDRAVAAELGMDYGAYRYRRDAALAKLKEIA